MTPSSLNQPQIVFVGLGNPGLRYEMTRHNMGFLVVKALARHLGWELKEEKRFNSLIVKGMCEGVTIHLILPLTFMNLSGTALRRYLDFYKLPFGSVVVVTDDIALAFGQMRLKTMGSAGGHNGLKSVEEYLGTAQYIRLRMGIGHPGVMNLAEYVLEPFSQEEIIDLPVVVDRGREVLLRIMKEDISPIMNTVNTIPRPSPKKVALVKESIDLTKPPLEGEEKTHESR